MRYMKDHGLPAAGTIRSNRQQGCPLQSSKDLEREGRGAMDYKVDANSGIMVVKWVDDSSVLLISIYVGIKPLAVMKRWSKESKAMKDISCPHIVIMYSKIMGGVHLAGMPTALYRIEVKQNGGTLKFSGTLLTYVV